LETSLLRRTDVYLFVCRPLFLLVHVPWPRHPWTFKHRLVFITLYASSRALVLPRLGGPGKSSYSTNLIYPPYHHWWKTITI
jgi:hypothetical protein